MKYVSFSCPKDPSSQKLGSQAKRCALQPADTQTDTKVTTEGTLSGFQDFFLQPIIKDRPNNGIGESIPKLGTYVYFWCYIFTKTQVLQHGIDMSSIDSNTSNYEYISIIGKNQWVKKLKSLHTYQWKTRHFLKIVIMFMRKKHTCSYCKKWYTLCPHN